jgi:hypothetical protein
MAKEFFAAAAGLFLAGAAASAARGARPVPFAEGFENGGARPPGWTQEYVSGANLDWYFMGGGAPALLGSYPDNARGGTCNACFYVDDYGAGSPVARLVSPELDLGEAPQQPQLTFWHCMKDWEADQDELRVYYQTSGTGGWTLLATYTTSTPQWTMRALDLPEASRTFRIAFEGKAKVGYGVCIDDVAVTAAPTPPTILSASDLPPGSPGDPYSHALTAAAGVSPYAWSITNKEATDLAYAVEACADLLEGAWSAEGVSELSRADSNSWWQVTGRHDVPVTGAPARFMRLKVTRP